MDYMSFAEGHANEAERIVAENRAHMAKRGRQLGVKEGAELTLANTHATLAAYYFARAQDART